MKPARVRLLVLLLALAAGMPGSAQPIGLARESAVKAAFLYKFGSFVDYPPGTFRSPTEPFVIGVFGDDGVASELEQLTHGRSVDTHPVVVDRVRDPDDPGTPHILYAGGPREAQVRELLAAVRGPVLTVADRPLSGPEGPILFFTQQDGRVRFGASLVAAAAHRLQLSARLLAVAQQVEGR